MKKFVWAVILSLCAGSLLHAAAAKKINPEAKSFKYSTTIEKERPELDEETKRLIAAYRKNPTQENYAALREKVAKNYDEVVARKKAKLEELKQTAKHASKVEEMQEIVDEMLADRENRINQSMSRFTDARLRPGARETKDGFLPVLGAVQNVSIAYTPVTNEEYARFIKQTGRKAPKNWTDGSVPAGQEKYPVTQVSYYDAAAYCQWLTRQDGKAVYRLPTEKEWELAAGHMPKDADMNCGEGKGLSVVSAYAQTLSASGAVDMWGNVWEWTSTQKESSGKEGLAVKGGSWSSARTDCRTENRSESRQARAGYEDVGFRIVREK